MLVCNNCGIIYLVTDIDVQALVDRGLHFQQILQQDCPFSLTCRWVPRYTIQKKIISSMVVVSLLFICKMDHHPISPFLTANFGTKLKIRTSFSSNWKIGRQLVWQTRDANCQLSNILLPPTKPHLQTQDHSLHMQKQTSFSTDIFPSIASKFVVSQAGFYLLPKHDFPVDPFFQPASAISNLYFLTLNVSFLSKYCICLPSFWLFFSFY